MRGGFTTALLLVLAGGGLFAGGRREQRETQQSGALILSGKVRLVGNAHFPRLVFTDEEGRDWVLEGADRELLAPYEQRTLKVRGWPEYRELFLANGKKAGLERFLRNVVLLE